MVKLKLKGGGLTEFKQIIESFVSENFCSDRCRECHELAHDIVPMDYKNSYEKNIKKLFDDLFGG